MLRHELVSEKSAYEETRPARPKKLERDIDSIGDLSSNFSRIDGRAPNFFDGSDIEHNPRDRARRNFQNVSGIDPSVATKTMFIDEGELSDKQKLRKQIRTLEDEVIALKKVYREKLEARVSPLMT